MLDNKTMYAIGKAMAQYARSYVATTEDIQANKVIDFIPLLPQWKEGNYNVGEVVIYNNIPFKCVQSHSSVGIPTWNPIEAASLWGRYHGTDANHALPYMAPTGAHDAYMAGEFVIFEDEVIYECLIDNTIFDPATLPDNWKAMN